MFRNRGRASLGLQQEKKWTESEPPRVPDHPREDSAQRVVYLHVGLKAGPALFPPDQVWPLSQIIKSSGISTLTGVISNNYSATASAENA
jgi:hypothetical protein